MYYKTVIQGYVRVIGDFVSQQNDIKTLGIRRQRKHNIEVRRVTAPT